MIYYGLNKIKLAFCVKYKIVISTLLTYFLAASALASKISGFALDVGFENAVDSRSGWSGH